MMCVCSCMYGHARVRSARSTIGGFRGGPLTFDDQAWATSSLSHWAFSLGPDFKFYLYAQNFEISSVVRGSAHFPAWATVLLPSGRGVFLTISRPSFGLSKTQFISRRPFWKTLNCCPASLQNCLLPEYFSIYISCYYSLYMYIFSSLLSTYWLDSKCVREGPYILRLAFYVPGVTPWASEAHSTQSPFISACCLRIKAPLVFNWRLFLPYIALQDKRQVWCLP